MPYSFKAAHVSAEEEHGVLTVGFADDAASPSRYLLIQRQDAYDAQDRRLGMDRIYVEVESQSRSAYGGLLAIAFGDRTLSFRLDADAARALQVDGEIAVELADDDSKTQAALAILKRLAALEGIALFTQAPQGMHELKREAE